MKTLQDDQDATSVGTMCIQLCTRMQEDIKEAKKQNAVIVADNAIASVTTLASFKTESFI